MEKSEDLHKVSIEKSLRTLRKNAGFTLVDLGSETGFSPSYISKIETGRVSPSLNTIQKLLTALNSSIAEAAILSTLEKEPIISIPKKKLPANLIMLPSIGRPKFYVAGKQLDTKQKKHKLFLSFLELAPKQTSGELQSHVGEECVCVLKGKVCFYFKVNENFPQHFLEPGDVMHFKSSTPHYVKNIGQELAFLLIVR